LSKLNRAWSTGHKAQGVRLKVTPEENPPHPPLVKGGVRRDFPNEKRREIFGIKKVPLS
jgi:hypothetical protein